MSCAQTLESREKVKSGVSRAVARAARNSRESEEEDTSSESSASNGDLANMLEKILNSNQNVRAIKTTEACGKCNSSSHIESQCNKVKKCSVCERENHDYKDCWLLLDAIERKDITKQSILDLQRASANRMTAVRPPEPSMLAPQYMYNNPITHWPAYTPIPPWPMPNNNFDNGFRNNYSRDNRYQRESGYNRSNLN